MKTREMNGDYVSSTNRQKKRKKKSKRNYSWIKSLLLIVLTIAALIFLSLSPFFNIKTIEVKGAIHSKEDEIVAATDINVGNNGFKSFGKDVKSIFSLRYRNAEKKIVETQSYVKNVVVSFSLPDKVVVNLVERKPMCAVPYLGTYLLVDDEGVVLDSVNKLEEKLPSVSEIKIQSFKKGQLLTGKKLQCFDDIKKMIGAFNESDKEDTFKISNLITSFDVSDLNKMRFTVDGRVTVNVGGLEDLEYRIKFLKQIYSKSLKKEDKGYLDFSSSENPNFMPYY